MKFSLKKLFGHAVIMISDVTKKPSINSHLMKTDLDIGEFRVDSRRQRNIEVIYFAILALSDLKGNFIVKNQISLKGRKSMNNQKDQLDYADVGSIFTENKVPMRNLVQDLKVDAYKRSLFLDHLKTVQEGVAKRKLDK